MVSRLNDIAPEDIESIEIIKGPAAATLYGTEASNGVIQIITKRGPGAAAKSRDQLHRPAGHQLVPESRGPDPDELRPGSGDRRVVSQNLVQQENDRGTPIWNNGYSGSYSLSATRRLQRGAVLPLGHLRRRPRHRARSTRPAAVRRARQPGRFRSTRSSTSASSLNFMKAKYHLGADYGDGVLFNTLFGSANRSRAPRPAGSSDPAGSVLLGRVRQYPGLSPTSPAASPLNHRPSQLVQPPADPRPRSDRRGQPGADRVHAARTWRNSSTRDRPAAPSRSTASDITFYTADYYATGRFALSSKLQLRHLRRRPVLPAADRLDLGVQGQQFPCPGVRDRHLHRDHCSRQPGLRQQQDDRPLCPAAVRVQGPRSS